MAFVVKDRVKETTTTTGTSDLVLSGSVSGFQSFSNALADGDTTYYALFEVSTNEWEVGVGTWTESTTTLARTTVLASSNSGSKVSLTAQAEVFITQPAGKAAFFDPSGDLTLVQDPSSNLQAATKQYVDTIAAAGLHYHDPVRVEQEGNLSATYSNGTAGVGATLTNNSTQAALTIDGVALSLNDRVLIYEQTNGYENGIYTVTNVGSASTNWVLTRATDADSYAPSDPDSLGQGDAFFVLEGTAGAGELYVMNTEGTITFGTTNITFTQVAATAVYTAGTGLTLTGTEFAADGANITNVDAVTLDGIDSSQFLRSDTVDTKTAGNLNFSDNVKAIFGAGSDLQIYHDSSTNNSVINESGSGNLTIQGNELRLQTAAGGNYFRGVNGGASSLFYSNTAKLATTSTGIDVTGTVTADGLTVDGEYSTSNGIMSAAGSFAMRLDSDNNQNGRNFSVQNYDGSANYLRVEETGDISFYDTSGNAKFFWDASAESLGIGTSSPSANLNVASSNATIHLTDTDDTTYAEIRNNGGTFTIASDEGTAATNSSINFRVDATERMRIDSSGNLFVGKTTNDSSVVGAQLNANGTVIGTADGVRPAIFNRKTSDGDIISLRKDGTTVGSIGSAAGSRLFIGNGDTGIRFAGGLDTIVPWNTNNSLRDAAIDLGEATGRFKDLYLSGSLSDGTTSRTVADIVGLTSSQFLRSDADDSASGDITFTESIQVQSGGGSANPIRIGNGFGSGGTATIHKYGAPLYLQYGNGQTSTDLYVGGGGTTANLRMQGGYIDNISSAYVQDYIYHQGDTDTYINFGTDTITLATGGSSEITVNTTGVRLGDTGNGYFQPVSGNYGSIQIDGGAHGGYEGYSIGGRVVFMHDNNTSSGIYNDVNNEWMLKCDLNGAVHLYYDASSKIQTTSTGANVNGALTATTKSFVIDHPTKEGMKLRYGSLEGPEDGVYVRGRLTGETVIELPDYWTGLVHEDSITVQLTAMGGKADLWVESIADNKVTVGCDTEVDCFYFVQATRKDVEAWDVEYVADS